MPQRKFFHRDFLHKSQKPNLFYTNWRTEPPACPGHDRRDQRFRFSRNARDSSRTCPPARFRKCEPRKRPLLRYRLVHAGRITKPVRPRPRNDAKKFSNCFHGIYFLFSKRSPYWASTPVTISARASTHSPSKLPRMSHGAIRTRPLFRMRFTFPEFPMVYAYRRAVSLLRSLAGSAANHTGVFTPSPLFLNVSRFKYFCPANDSNAIAALLLARQFAIANRCALFYMSRRYKGRSDPAGAPFAPLRKGSSYFVRTYVTSSVKASFCSFRNVQVVLK